MIKYIAVHMRSNFGGYLKVVCTTLIETRSVSLSHFDGAIFWDKFCWVGMDKAHGVLINPRQSVS